MGERRIALENWLTESAEVVSATLSIVAEIKESQSAIGMELASWHELMAMFDSLDRQADALREALGR